MKSIKKFVVLALAVFMLSSCNNVHTGKVVIDENKKTEQVKNIDIEYIIVDEDDKDSLIQNIKDGKGAIITKSRFEENEEKENQNNEESTENENDNDR